jgi:AcrR family transcriptional regulator
MGTDDTKESILDAAERLFADHGFAATSLRGITSEAGVNLAAVNYHFGSKEELIRAVFRRRLDPLNRERLELLDDVEARAGDEAPPIERIVRSFVGPALRMGQRLGPAGETFMRMLGHASSEPSEQISRMFYEQFREVGERFQHALRRSLPELTREEVFWRLMFMVGSMAHTLAVSKKICRMFLDTSDTPDAETLMEHMVPFLVAGMRAPVPAGEPGGGS